MNDETLTPHERIELEDLRACRVDNAAEIARLWRELRAAQRQYGQVADIAYALVHGEDECDGESVSVAEAVERFAKHFGWTRG